MKSKSSIRKYSQTRREISLVIFWGCLTSLIAYKFGYSDHIEQFPYLFREMDGSFLTQDFFTNAGEGFGPRTYYNKLIAFLANGLTFPLSLLMLTLLSNIGIGLVTYFAAKDLFPRDQLVGLVAAGLSLGAMTAGLGYGYTLYDTYLTPGLLATPFMLTGIYFGWKGKFWQSALVLGTCSLIHVLIGLETGLLVLGALSLTAIRDKKFKQLFPQLLLAGIILLVFALFSLIPHFQQTTGIDDQLFIEIVAFFRHPHHYVPSHFLLQQPLPKIVLDLSFIVFGIVICWVMKGELVALGSKYAHIVILFGLLGIACLFGWIFVEFIPLKLIVIAQPFRLLQIAKWLAQLILSGYISMFFTAGLSNQGGLMLLASAVSPTALGTLLILEKIREKYQVSLISVFVLMSYAVLIFWGNDYFLSILLVAITTISILLFQVQAGKWLWLLPVVFGGIFLLKSISPTTSGKYAGLFSIPYKTIQVQEEEKALMGFIDQRTPSKSILIVPPDLGITRIAARRAIVVDWKAFPFDELAMKEWFERVKDLYGENPKEKETFYKNLGDEKLLELAQKYGADYAVIFRETNTRFEVVFESPKYRVVKIIS